MQPSSKTRVTFIDWMRGVAALIMLQGHTFDAFLRPADRTGAEVIFTAHSIPAAMDARSRYSLEIAESCRLTARDLELARWSIAYQSRSGNPREPWLEHFEWLEPMFNERLELRDGRMHVPNRPGLGFSLSDQARAWTKDTASFGSGVGTLL